MSVHGRRKNDKVVNFPGWISAPVVLPVLVDTHFRIEVETLGHEVKVKWFDDAIYSVIPVENHEEFNQLEDVFIKEFSDEYGLNDKMKAFYLKPVNNELIHRIKIEIENSLHAYLPTQERRRVQRCFNEISARRPTYMKRLRVEEAINAPYPKLI